MQHQELHELFVKELQDVFSAETQILDALPLMVEKATSENLKAAFEKHLKQTESQADKLTEAADILKIDLKGERCEGMAGIIAEGSKIIKSETSSTATDAALIGAAQKVEHYEIATYGTLCSWAAFMGHTEVEAILQEILEQEKATDVILTELAESEVNPESK
jgi:ferritin-like metal-binding protein YciE